ncbi:MAG: insulinase family protein [Planctomycetes bacterium]|nr:insulinase family protein [Planctomycetota bacterium]
MRRLPSAAPLLGVLVILTGPPATRADVPLFDYRDITLNNGLHVITLEDFSCPIVAVQLWYHVGSKNEDPERQGFAHMFEHMMFRGTDRLGPTGHFNNIRQTGGDCNAYTFFDQTVYHETLPANQLELALWLEAERMSFLKIDQESFDTERKVVEEERRQGLNQPYGTVLEQILANLFKEHPYRWSPIGNIAHLRATRVQELRDFWARYYVPNNAILVIVGAVRHAEAQALARRCFGWIPRYPDPPQITTREPARSRAKSVRIKEDNAPAPAIGVIYRTVPLDHADHIPLQLLGQILGGGESSRLYREVVAEKQLAVMAAAAAFALEQDGFFVAGGVMAPFGGKPKRLRAVLDSQLQRLRSEPVSERELLKARNQMLKDLVTENLTINSKASALGSAATLEGDVARVNERLAQIRRVTVEDLQRVAQTYLAPTRALRIEVQRNLLGTLFGKKASEDEAPITAEPEEVAPPPGRPGLTRPVDYPPEPPLAGPLDFDPTLAFGTHELANGLRVIVVPNHEVPFVSIRLGLLSGAWTEPKPGVCMLALGMLTKGTAAHTEGELADELETYAIALSGEGEMDSSQVRANCLTEHLDRALALMAEVVLTPTFPADEFEKLRRQVLTGLAISTNRPAYIADREFRQRLYGDHPYARTETGEIEDVNALEVADLRQWWEQYARPDRAVMVFAGDIELDRAVSLAESAFGEWSAAGPPPQNELPDPPQPAETHIYLVDRPGVQSEIRVGQLGPTRHDPGYATSRVVSGYFGDAFGSRLNESIRVEKGLTYGASGGYTAGRFAGTFRARTFTKTKSTAETVQVIFDELKRLQDEPPTPDELEKTKSYILGNFASGRETPQQVANQLWLLVECDLPQGYFGRLLETVAQTTAADCAQLAQTTVDPSRMVVVVVGDAKAVKPDLERIAPVTVVELTPEAPAPRARERSGGE